MDRLEVRLEPNGVAAPAQRAWQRSVAVDLASKLPKPAAVAAANP